VCDLIDSYESKSMRRFEDIVRFHWELERIHPFLTETAAWEDF